MIPRALLITKSLGPATCNKLRGVGWIMMQTSVYYSWASTVSSGIRAYCPFAEIARGTKEVVRDREKCLGDDLRSNSA